MSAVLIISIFLLALATFAIFRSKRSTSTDSAAPLPPVPPRALFEIAETETEVRADADETRRELTERVLRGDAGALREAHAARDRALYNDVLDALVRQRGSVGPEALRLLGHEIIRGDELRANASLTRALLEVWHASPTRDATLDLLRIAALSDEAETFRETVEAVYRRWRAGELRGMKPAELGALFESEYWVLSSDAQRSGAGFVLKQTLAEIGRALAQAARRESETSTEAV